jgi:hypothetical protein
MRQLQDQRPKVAGGERVAHSFKVSSLCERGLRFAAAAGLRLAAPQNLGDARSRKAFSPGNLSPKCEPRVLRVAVPIRLLEAPHQSQLARLERFLT